MVDLFAGRHTDTLPPEGGDPCPDCGEFRSGRKICPGGHVVPSPGRAGLYGSFRVPIAYTRLLNNHKSDCPIRKKPLFSGAYRAYYRADGVEMTTDRG